MPTCPAHGNVTVEVESIDIRDGFEGIIVNKKYPVWSCGCLPGVWEAPAEPQDAIIIPEDWP